MPLLALSDRPRSKRRFILHLAGDVRDEKYKDQADGDGHDQTKIAFVPRIAFRHIVFRPLTQGVAVKATRPLAAAARAPIANRIFHAGSLRIPREK